MDPEPVQITSVPPLLRQTQNTLKTSVIFRIWQMVIFPKKETFHQCIDPISITLNLSKLFQQFISLLRITPNTFKTSEFDRWEIFPTKEIPTSR